MRVNDIIQVDETETISIAGGDLYEDSEGSMAQSLKVDVKDARDSASVFVPDVKAGMH